MFSGHAASKEVRELETKNVWPEYDVRNDEKVVSVGSADAVCCLVAVVSARMTDVAGTEVARPGVGAGVVGEGAGAGACAGGDGAGTGIGAATGTGTETGTGTGTGFGTGPGAGAGTATGTGAGTADGLGAGAGAMAKGGGPGEGFAATVVSSDPPPPHPASTRASTATLEWRGCIDVSGAACCAKWILGEFAPEHSDRRRSLPTGETPTTRSTGSGQPGVALPGVSQNLLPSSVGSG